MSAPDRGDVGRMPRGGEPVMDGGADRASADRGLARAVVPRDEQQHAVAVGDCFVEGSIDRTPRSVEAHPMEIDGPVRLDAPAAEALVPATVESCSEAALLRRRNSRCGTPDRFRLGLGRSLSCRHRRVRLFLVAGERTDRRGDARPERRLLRGERAHAPPRPSAAGHKRRRCRTFRPQSASHPGHCPRRCRSGSGP